LEGDAKKLVFVWRTSAEIGCGVLRYSDGQERKQPAIVTELDELDFAKSGRYGTS